MQERFNVQQEVFYCYRNQVPCGALDQFYWRAARLLKQVT